MRPCSLPKLTKRMLRRDHNSLANSLRMLLRAGMKLLAAQKASASTASSLLLIAEFTFFLLGA